MPRKPKPREVYLIYDEYEGVFLDEVCDCEDHAKSWIENHRDDLTEDCLPRVVKFVEVCDE